MPLLTELGINGLGVFYKDGTPKEALINSL